MNQRPISKEFEDTVPQFKWSQEGQPADVRPAPAQKAKAITRRFGETETKESPERRQLELLWERIQKNQRIERVTGWVRRMGLASVWASIATFVSSLPQAARTCANVVTQQATPFRVGLAAGAVALLILGLVLLAGAAKRWFL